MEAYQVGDTIPLYFIRLNQGTPVTGLSVTVVVTDASSGSTLLSSTALTEVTPGFYVYNWSSGGTVTAQTTCVETYTVAGVQYKNTFVIGNDDLETRAT